MVREAGLIRRSSINAIARVIGHSGFAMVGALCGLFVADLMARTDIDMFGSVIFFIGMMLSGFAGFYRGIDAPPSHCHGCRVVDAGSGFASKMARAQLLSSAGTFLAATAALVSVGFVVLDESLPMIWTLLVGALWGAGVTMQIAAGIKSR